MRKHPTGRGTPPPDRKSWTGHLDDLRRVLLRCLVAWLAATLLAVCFSGSLLDWLRLPLRWAFAESVRPALAALSPAAPFLVNLKLALLAGLVVSLPVWAAWLAAFLSPALRPRERRLAFPMAAAGVVLFVLGGSFAFRGLIPLILRFFAAAAARAGAAPVWGIEGYAGLTVGLIGAFGVAFEFPLLILGLAWLGLVDRDRLRASRPAVVVGVLIAAALLTPPDVISQVFLAVPLLILFEICVFLTKFIVPPRSGPGGKNQGTGSGSQG